MKLHDQVASLDLCKRLRELEVPQNSHFYWENCPHYKKFKIHDIDNHDVITGEYGDCHLLTQQEHYSAFTVAELVLLLLTEIEKIENREIQTGEKKDILYRYHPEISFFCNDRWHCFYIGFPVLEGIMLDFISSLFGEHDKSMANAIAKMLIHLIENKLYKPEVENERVD